MIQGPGVHERRGGVRVKPHLMHNLGCANENVVVAVVAGPCATLHIAFKSAIRVGKIFLLSFINVFRTVSFERLVTKRALN